MGSVLHYVGKIDNVNLDEIVDKSKYDTYVEPFAGSFSCGFNFIEHGFMGKAVLNDTDTQLINFWKQMKRDSDKVYDRIIELNDKVKKSKWGYSELRLYLENYQAGTHNNCKKAAAEYLIHLNKKFNYYTNDEYIPENIKTTLDDFYMQHVLLNNVNIECMDYTEVIEKYDSNRTLFLLDPPYNIKNVTQYYRNVAGFNHQALREYMDTVQGDWLLRYNEEDLTDSLYSDIPVIFSTENVYFGKKYKEKFYGRLNKKEVQE